MSRRHIILVGLPGSGKSAAGSRAAARLGAPFVDLDVMVAARAARTVAELFAVAGEAAFRALEHAAAAEALAGPPGVLAPGGGWFADAAERRTALAAGYAIYLMTSPAVAARRLGGAGGRPLLLGDDPLTALEALLARREAAYLEAPGRVATDGLGLDAVAERIVELARAEGGW